MMAKFASLFEPSRVPARNKMIAPGTHEAHLIRRNCGEKAPREPANVFCNQELLLLLGDVIHMVGQPPGPRARHPRQEPSVRPFCELAHRALMRFNGSAIKKQ
jgi:hypothetical protein